MHKANRMMRFYLERRFPEIIVCILALIMFFSALFRQPSAAPHSVETVNALLFMGSALLFVGVAVTRKIRRKVLKNREKETEEEVQTKKWPEYQVMKFNADDTADYCHSP